MSPTTPSETSRRTGVEEVGTVVVLPGVGAGQVVRVERGVTGFCVASVAVVGA